MKIKKISVNNFNDFIKNLPKNIFSAIAENENYEEEEYDENHNNNRY